MTERVCSPEGERAPPQCRAFAESGAANAVSLHAPSREKAILENPQIFQNCEIINILSADDAQQRRRPPPAAETGRSCWGSGQQDASAAQGTMRMLGAATRKKRSAFNIVPPVDRQSKAPRTSGGNAGRCMVLLKFADHRSILPKLKSAKSSTRSVRLGATGAALSASRGA